MNEIMSDRTYPHPSASNFITAQKSESKMKSKKDTKSKKKNLSRNPATKPATRAAKQDLLSVKKNLKFEEVEISDKNNASDDTKTKSVANIFSFTPSLSEIIQTPLELKKLNCDLTRNEIKEAKKAMQTRMLENLSLGGSFNDYTSPFKPNEEYECGDLDFICNRFRNHSNLSHGPMMVSNNGQLSSSIEILAPSTFNSLIRIMLSRSFEKSEDLILQALNDLPNGMPTKNFDELIIPVFSTVGMKKRFKAGEFQYDNTAGHYITLHMKMNSSTVSVYDHCNEELTKSTYFDFVVISKALQAIHDYYSKKNEPAKALKFIQNLMKPQSSVDCGPHCLANVELLLHQRNPALQTFDRQTITTIRCYHFLLRELMLNEFRVDLC